MALYIPHSIFHLARLLYVRPETFGPYHVVYDVLVNLSLTKPWQLLEYENLNNECRIEVTNVNPSTHGCYYTYRQL